MTPERPVRPADAAGLVLIRAASRGQPEILLGRRHAKAGFLPDVFVFPGGRVEPGDRRPSGSTEPLSPRVRDALRIGAGTTDPLVFARCALRETHEETGLIVGVPPSAAEPHWHGPTWEPYRSQGMRPAFEAMDFVLRAITPTNMPRRYNTRFFLADGALAHGSIGGDGELEDLAWWPLSAIDDLPLVDVTQAVLREALARWGSHDNTGEKVSKLLIYKYNNIVIRPLLMPRHRSSAGGPA